MAKTLSDLKTHLLDRAAEISSLKDARFGFSEDVMRDLRPDKLPCLHIRPAVPGSTLNTHELERGGPFQVYNLQISVYDVKLPSDTANYFDRLSSLQRLLMKYLLHSFNKAYATDFNLVNASDTVNINYFKEMENAALIQVQAELRVQLHAGTLADFSDIV